MSIGGGEARFVNLSEYISENNFALFALFSSLIIAVAMVLSELSNYISKSIARKVSNKYESFCLQRAEKIKDNLASDEKKEFKLIGKEARSCGGILFLIIQSLGPLIKFVVISLYLLLFYYKFAVINFVAMLVGGWFFYKANLETIKASRKLYERVDIDVGSKSKSYDELMMNRNIKFMSRHKFNLISGIVLSIGFGVIFFIGLNMLHLKNIKLADIFIIFVLIKLSLSSAGDLWRFIGLINNHYPQIKAYFSHKGMTR